MAKNEWAIFYQQLMNRREDQGYKRPIFKFKRKTSGILLDIIRRKTGGNRLLSCNKESIVNGQLLLTLKVTNEIRFFNQDIKPVRK